MIGVLSFYYARVIGKHNFEVINGFTPEKLADAEAFATWMHWCYSVMGWILVGAAALIVYTKTLASGLVLAVAGVSVVLVVMMAGGRRFYRV